MEKDTLTYPHTTDVLTRYAILFIERYKMALVESGRPASGALSNRLSYNIVTDNGVFAVDISLMEYWKYIEDGTRPHFPPLAAIEDWIRVKPVLPRPMRDGRLPSDKQLAFLIGRKISLVGTEGSHDLSRSNEEILAEMQESLYNAITEDIEENIDIIFTQFTPR